MELSYRWAAPGEALDEAYDVRTEVFVREQGFSLEIEIDELDPVAHHLVVSDGAGPVATGRIFADESDPLTYHIGRVAVKLRRRGTGLGRDIMLEMERRARELGARRTVLGAQRQAEGFYAGLGYAAFGEEYYDEHCPHIHMEKTLCD